MKFLIDKQTLSADQQLFLANFELSVKQYIELVLRDYLTLGVTPNWSVVERKDKFFIIESNAGFDIKDSLFVNSKIESYIAENGGYPPTQNGDIRSLFWLFSLMALQN